MSNVFIESAPDGHFIFEHENGSTHTQHHPAQQAAIDRAEAMGHHMLVARVRHLNEKKIPDQPVTPTSKPAPAMRNMFRRPPLASTSWSLFKLASRTG